MAELSIREARNDLAEVVNRAAYRDEVTYVVRRGKPVAAVVPAEAAQTRAQAEAAAVVMAAADRAARDAANRSAAVVADLRRQLTALAEEHARCGTGTAAASKPPPRPTLPEGNDPALLRLRTVAALATLDGTLKAVRTEVESGRWQQATHEADRLAIHVESLRGLLAALTG